MCTNPNAISLDNTENLNGIHTDYSGKTIYFYDLNLNMLNKKQSEGADLRRA